MARKKKWKEVEKFISKAKFKKTSISRNPSRIKWSSMNKHKKRSMGR
jgi:hypothetical protein|tara:strand:- start:450 stop:590 length:141 start_codon:yes stop_codon:yes gene_type:complete